MGSFDNGHAATIAFLAFPFGTHAAPLFSLAAALATSSPTSKFSFFNSSRSNSTLRNRPDSPKNLEFYDVKDGWPQGRPPSPDPEEEVRLFLAVSPSNFQDVMKGEGVKVSCIVSDAFLWFAEEMAREIGVAWVPVWTGGPASLVAHLYTDFLRDKFVAPGGRGLLCKGEEQITCIPCLSSLRLQDLPEGLISGDLTSVFAVMLHNMSLILPKASALIVNTFLGLDPSIDTELQTQFPTFLPVGPVNLLAPQPPELNHHSTLAWLDNHPPSSVAYISFGTVISPPPSELAELAMGLESSGIPFLWSLKPKLTVHLPNGFLNRTADRGLVVPWVPQVQALCHVAVGGFLTHCGWNSVLESIAGGVPLVCRPFLGDQRINARMISHVWGVGVTVEGGVLTCEGVKNAFGLVVKGEEGRKMRERAGRLKEMAIQAVRTGGDSVLKFQELKKVVTS